MAPTTTDLRLNILYELWTSLPSKLEFVSQYLLFNSISATIYSEVVDLDGLTPKIAGVEREGTATILSVTLQVASTDFISQRRVYKDLSHGYPSMLILQSTWTTGQKGIMNSAGFLNDPFTYRVELNAQKPGRGAISVMQCSRAPWK